MRIAEKVRAGQDFPEVSTPGRTASRNWQALRKIWLFCADSLEAALDRDEEMSKMSLS